MCPCVVKKHETALAEMKNGRKKSHWIWYIFPQLADLGYKEVITWNYTKFQTDMWRYQTKTMDQSHDTVVSPGDKVFSYGMNRLGWPYEVREFWVD
ncbi:DUF1810 family protein [Selenomonas ruminantium]|nr:DUF1810 family protein [Selenomonas ruminantium]